MKHVAWFTVNARRRDFRHDEEVIIPAINRMNGPKWGISKSEI